MFDNFYENIVNKFIYLYGSAPVWPSQMFDNFYVNIVNKFIYLYCSASVWPSQMSMTTWSFILSCTLIVTPLPTPKAGALERTDLLITRASEK